ncbi:1A family penicillin-binding protein [Melghirimyces profundicolus]|uniref:1A family penicillin-binding protein n=1 Tax=Melghirimyces profundicolus TaxID=1242148 RepID=A0A2T6C295_9BACL|nr:PBP1A family penicillin-binding protein [Melghirimyces profundicolus]PTX62454.1 1A family penicillin-binding protein [Melghirimyces profundicolus]
MGDDMNRTLPPETSWEDLPFGKWWARIHTAARWFGFCLTVGVGLALITVLYLKSKPLPPPQIGLTTQIVDARGNLIDHLDRGERRDPVKLKELPRSVIDATLTAEDQHFYEHWGFSPKGILRAALVNLKQGRVSQGASTITQQLARNLYLTHDRNWSRKWKEATLTAQLELHFSKNEILRMYLNKIYYGHGAYGIERAARIYFGKPARDLTLAESAMLAGIPRGPRWYSPLDNPSSANIRQKAILNAMVKNGRITRAEAETAKKEPLVYADPPRPQPARASYFRDYVIQAAVSKYGLEESQVRNGGLKIHTTLDLNMQEKAETALKHYLKNDRELQGALISLNPQNGHIKAMVGGKDYHQSQYNRVFGKRQPGSTFKPILYLAALENGLTPASRFASQPTTFLYRGGKYRPTNYHGRYARRPITMAEALATSDNIYAVHTHLAIGEEEAVRMGRRLGIRSPLKPVPSLALGTSAVSPFEMAKVYATLAGGGLHQPPTAILRIEDSEGNILAESRNTPEQVLTPAESYVMTSMLKGVFAPGGTANRIKQILSRPVAGKTGSTDWDSWLSGFTPDLTTTVWVGYDKGKPLPPGTSRLTHNIWGRFMKEALESRSAKDFRPPDGVVKVKVDPQTGERATDTCPQSSELWFLSGTEPKSSCSVHRPSVPSPVEQPSLWERIKKWWSG